MAIAQINIGRLVVDPDHPQVAEFMNNLDRVNAIAERSDGFIWRLKDDAGNATSIQIDGDPRFIPNMSTWRDLTSLQNFVFKTVHKSFLQRRNEWFERLNRPYFLMWMIDEEERPTLEDALARLDAWQIRGESEAGFTWASVKDGAFQAA